MKKYLNILAITAGASLLGAASAQAQLVAYDGFNYTAFDGSGGGSGDWAYPWYDKSGYSTIVGGSMSYSTLPTSGNNVGQTGASGTTQLWRVLNNNFGFYANYNTVAPGTLWMSYMWASDNTGTLDPNGSGYYLFRQASVGFYVGGNASSSAGSEYLDIGMPNISAASAPTYSPNVSLWYGGHGLSGQSGGATAPNVQSSVAANNYNQDFILIKMTLDNDTTTADTIDVWINPTLGGSLGAADMSYNMQDLSAINTIRMSANGNNATYGGYGSQQFDEFRIGWDANSVETLSTATVVPEPASMALLGLGSLGLLLFRRKK